MGKWKPLKGMKFGKLTVLEDYRDYTKSRNRHYCRCECSCGKIIHTASSQLLSGKTKSCGCIKRDEDMRQIYGAKNIKHGMGGTRFYNAWYHALKRCENPKDRHYNNYGGRGIKICDRWHDFLNFKDDMYESYLTHVKEFGEKNTTLDRIDFNGNYCKENCRWATYMTQNRNRRNTRMFEYNGESHTLVEWANIIGINHKTLASRIYSYMWDTEKALNVPLRGRIGVLNEQT